MDYPIGRRLVARQPVKIAAQCRVRATVYPVQITDFSGCGCRICCRNAHFGMGQRLAIIVDGCAELTGTVRWRNSDSAGMEFQTGLAQHIVDRICALSMNPMYNPGRIGTRLSNQEGGSVPAPCRLSRLRQTGNSDWLTATITGPRMMP